jgi:SAM-dependent methyltransferase
VDTLLQHFDRRRSELEGLAVRPDEPSRAGERDALAAKLRRVVAGRRALEVACGTGFWTRVASEVARKVVAVDLSSNLLDLSRRPGMLPDAVVFGEEEAGALERIPGTFDCGFAVFWLSHVPKGRLLEFLGRFHGKLEPGARVLLADDVHVPGKPGAGSGEGFRVRQLSDASASEVLRNYGCADELFRVFDPWAEDLEIHIGRCYWWATYRIRAFD